MSIIFTLHFMKELMKQLIMYQFQMLILIPTQINLVSTIVLKHNGCL